MSGSKNILELHGTLHEIHCIKCGNKKKRNNYQNLLKELNPKWEEFLKNIELFKIKPKLRPDGDIDLPLNISYENFNYKLFCENCNDYGLYKPSIIFFGENIKNFIKLNSNNMIKNCDTMIIIGSSLVTLSAFRLVRYAYDLDKNIII
jgi:NAD-dependent deacetylase sirtuin 4